MSAYYNENDPKAAAWLRELIKQGHVAPGHVDERSITDVRPTDLLGFSQCHFFAGIGGWSLALRLAGWSDERPVWTGSCPCQPFSTAGKQLGAADERHLWPVFFALIAECGPVRVFGEQVANAIGKGWLDGVSADLEGAGYACGAAVLGAHSVGAPHIRQRLFWVADADCSGSQPGRQTSEADRYRDSAFANCGAGRLVQPVGAGLEGHAGHGDHGHEPGRLGAGAAGSTAATGGDFWSRFDLIPCADGKARRIEPGLAPLAHGVPARVVRLRGYGNAIVPQVAAEFIQACEEALEEAA